MSAMATMLMLKMLIGRPRFLAPWTRAAVAAVLAFALSSIACYKPTITDNGFQCSAALQCPDGYTCGADNHCSLHPLTVVKPVDSGMDTGMMTMVDGGPDAMMCATPVTSLCAAGPAAGDTCSPSCQNGCGACVRCNVVDGKPACVPPGTVKVGDVCTPGDVDNCAPGLICLLESCGNGLARCYRHCTSNDQCDGTACTITINDNDNQPTPFTTCDVPARTCDPGGSDDRLPGSRAGLLPHERGQDALRLPGKPATQGGNGAACNLYSDCAPGFFCIASGNGQTTPHCHFVCNVAAPSCPQDPSTGMPAACLPVGTGSPFGSCGI